MNTVKVVADANGAIIMQSKNNPEYGSIRVEQNAVKFGRWVNLERRVAFIQGTMEALQTAVKELNLKADSTIEGRIIVKEQFTPFYEGQSPKTFGDSGFPCLLDGAEIYRQTYFTTDSHDVDEFITHNNTEDYRNHMASTESNNKMIAAEVEEAFDVEDLNANIELGEEIFEL